MIERNFNNLDNEFGNILNEYPDTGVIFGSISLMHFAIAMEKAKTSLVLAFGADSSFDKTSPWIQYVRGTRKHYFETTLCTDFKIEPKIATIDKMVKVINDTQADAVIAIGNGEVMDAVKTAYFVAQAKGKVRDYFGVNKFSGKYPARNLKRVYCFPTTAGSGAEVTPFATILDEKSGLKKQITEVQMIPEYSFLDPDFIVETPEKTVVSEAIHALTHSLEGFLNVKQDQSCPHAENWAFQSVKAIVDNLPKFKKGNTELEIREDLMIAASLGGMVIRYKAPGVPHFCSLLMPKGMDHGNIVGIIMPYAWKYYIADEKVKQRSLKLNKVFKCKSRKPEAAINAYIKFLKTMNIPTCLKDVSRLSRKQVNNVADELLRKYKPELKLAPNPISGTQAKDIVSEILDNAWNGTL